ncbi:MAG: hypothetical protein HLUCCA05_08900 [Roseibaca calidilacus]|uniref:Uncharacterized protein n=1 Tax=Roseibaca calidilacus TaxID=1666912 RepID=A0A0P7WXJ8_9RHOB|nr:hypothetical protein [Roseibaca calidilacus]KPP92390.1 MAG: hypothetical protein HLUCCA05_08900 [Roseibaca calidilacus]CUX79685.1 hypothetical protein Ga0058931_0369 [Roseibaca calidilacus]
MGGGRDYYFRPRPGGAMLLRIAYDARLRRSEMHRIAGINRATGAVNVADGHELTDPERALIDAWLASGNGMQGDAAKAAEQIGHIAHWAQFKASPAELAAATEELLLAMQDLREVLVRKAAQRAQKPE